MVKEKLIFSWEVGMLPFFWKTLSQPTNPDDIPDLLPLELCVDLESGLLMLHPDKDVICALSKIYSEGSIITGVMEGEGIGSSYA